MLHIYIYDIYSIIVQGFPKIINGREIENLRQALDIF